MTIKESRFFIELQEIIFEYLEGELEITPKNEDLYISKTITIALFVKKRRKELLKLLKKYA